MDDLVLQHQYSFKSQFLQIPDVDHSIFTASCKSAVPSRSLSTCELKVSLPHISDDLEFTFRVALIDHDPTIKGANYE